MTPKNNYFEIVFSVGKTLFLKFSFHQVFKHLFLVYEFLLNRYDYFFLSSLFSTTSVASDRFNTYQRHWRAPVVMMFAGAAES